MFYQLLEDYAMGKGHRGRVIDREKDGRLKANRGKKPAEKPKENEKGKDSELPPAKAGGF